MQSHVLSKFTTLNFVYAQQNSISQKSDRIMLSFELFESSRIMIHHDR